MPQTSLEQYVEALDQAHLLTRYTDEKRVDELPQLMEQNPDTHWGILMGHLKKYAETGQTDGAFDGESTRRRKCVCFDQKQGESAGIRVLRSVKAHGGKMWPAALSELGLW